VASNYGRAGGLAEDELENLYRRFETSEKLAPLAAPEPKEEVNAADPWFHAKKASENMTKFVKLAAEVFRLSPEKIFFAVELSSLVVFNALDRRVSNTVRDAARKAAYDYYVESLPKVPDAPIKP
jgi:hypothetical protein